MSRPQRELEDAWARAPEGHREAPTAIPSPSKTSSRSGNVVRWQFGEKGPLGRSRP